MDTVKHPLNIVSAYVKNALKLFTRYKINSNSSLKSFQEKNRKERKSLKNILS